MDLEMLITVAAAGLFIYTMKQKPAVTAPGGGGNDTPPPPPGGDGNDNPPPPPPPGDGGGGDPPPPPPHCINSPTEIGYTGGIISNTPIVWARAGVLRPADVPAGALYWNQQSDGYRLLPTHNYGFGIPNGPGGVPYCPPPDWLGYQ